MLEADPAGEGLFVVADGEDVAQGIDLELVEVFVDDGVEERFKLDDARVDFGLLLLEEGIVGGGIGGVGGVLRVAETERLRTRVGEARFDCIDGTEDELVDGIDDVV